MRTLNYLKSIVKRLPGPLPNFSLIHVVLMLILLEEGIVGRKRLSSLMNLGEGSVRSLIKRLREAGLINTSKGGCYLSLEGKEIVKDLRRFLKGPIEIKLSGLVQGKVYGSLVKGVPLEKLRVLEIRDEAVRAGGEGAVILVYTKDGLMFPENSELLANYHPKDELKIIKAFKPGEGDIVILGLGSTPHISRLSAISAALSALESVNQP